MSVDTPPATDAAKPHTQRFRRAYQPNIATPDQRRRETEVLRLAWDALGSRERILAFLNAPAEPLGATPLQLASNSDAGLEQVAILLTQQRAVQVPAAPAADAAR